MFFSKNKVPRVNDVVFPGEQGFAKAIGSWLQQNVSGIVIAWFRDDLERIRQAHGNIDADRFVMADRFNPTVGYSPVLLFAGHYPLHSAELALCEKAGIEEMLVYSHLDMPLFRKFGSDKLKGMMSAMGMNEDEPLTHAMITRSIGNAQERIEKKCITDMFARSEEDWFQINLPEM